MSFSQLTIVGVNTRPATPQFRPGVRGRHVSGPPLSAREALSACPVHRRRTPSRIVVSTSTRALVEAFDAQCFQKGLACQTGGRRGRDPALPGQGDQRAPPTPFCTPTTDHTRMIGPQSHPRPRPGALRSNGGPIGHRRFNNGVADAARREEAHECRHGLRNPVWDGL